ncbi:helix-turn-helix transcriptional regulator [Paractinoplanes hotanensis]|uniref:Helix-turn-helix domain-containing protein n=1 Tax=Paractinoplanes hotanensis TaxID=2906497 RepID=A0ABT0Y8D6_9ACTN|nr:helix-turn-helix domain-containing protein [Actinoplanes hotanensis]MCM4082313.1 helix-turn-helix domain-containing protein [Actinoplanes hotanensis]
MTKTSRSTARAGHRSAVLRVLRESDEAMSIAAIASRLEIHPNTVRFHLETLVEAGQVEQAPVPPARPGRPPLMFRTRPGMDPAGRRNYHILAEMLLDGLDDTDEPADAALEIGRRWGLRHAAPPPGMAAAEAAAWLVRELDDIGFAPATDRADGIAIRNCPFLELVDQHGRAICAMHLGFMRGLMEGAGEPLRIRSLIPFDAPDRCRVITG